MGKYKHRLDKKVKLQAFTLAEVLVTLGIIGVVAAMTLPSLINKYKAKEASARLRKFYSMISQAILFSENVNGPSKNWTKYPTAKDEEGNVDAEADRAIIEEFFYTYIGPYIKYLKIEPTENSRKIRVYLSDGSTFTMHNGVCSDFRFDVNGLRLPNEFGRDIFGFLICPEAYRATYCDTVRNFCPYGGAISGKLTRETAFENCKSSSETCARLLMLDGWEFKDDYPYKL